MRIERVRLRNYRQYRDVSFAYPATREHDLHLIVGDNGLGKTNLMNAMCWCLYGRERYLSEQNAGLPVAHCGREGLPADYSVSVEVGLSWSADGESMTGVFERQDGDRSVFRWIVPSATGTESYVGAEAMKHVERFIPEAMKDYFFFDGEKLQQYLFEHSGNSVRQALFFLSKVTLIETVLEHMKSLEVDLQKKAAKGDPNTEALVSQKEGISTELRTDNAELLLAEKEKETAFQERERYARIVHGHEDAVELAKKQELLESQLGPGEATERDATLVAQAAMYRVALLLYSREAVTKFNAILEEKESLRQLPPPIEASVVQRMLDDAQCICERKLPERSPERAAIEALKRQVLTNSALGDAVRPIRGGASALFMGLARDVGAWRTARNHLDTIRQFNIQRRAELREIKEALYKHDLATVREAQRKHDEFADVFVKATERIGYLKGKIEDANGDLLRKQNEIEAANSKKQIVVQLRRELDLLKRAIACLEKARHDRIQLMRRCVESDFKTTFMDLMWQKDLYKDAYLDDSYGIHVVHLSGSEALATMAEGEKQCAAVAFTLALHEVAGYPGPIVVDFPFGRTNGQMKENMAQVFLDVSRRRQVILFVLKDEYQSVAHLLDPELASKHALAGRSGETTAEVIE
jgi:DNA sulfur modification protein DndD